MTISKERMQHWLRQDLWTFDEASHLLAGVEPGSDTPPQKRIPREIWEENLAVRLEAMTQANSETLAFQAAVIGAREAINRAVDSRALQLVKGKWIGPSELIRWAVVRQLPNCPFNLDSLANRPASHISLEQKRIAEKKDWILRTLRGMGQEPSKLPTMKVGRPGWRDAVKKKLPPLGLAPKMTEKQL